VVEWIEDYNHDRHHSALGMRSPIAYEQALTHAPPGQAA
jgi:transposase InsO family protein